jgi:hypothetical protein
MRLMSSGAGGCDTTNTPCYTHLKSAFAGREWTRGTHRLIVQTQTDLHDPFRDCSILLLLAGASSRDVAVVERAAYRCKACGGSASKGEDGGKRETLGGRGAEELADECGASHSATANKSTLGTAYGNIVAHREDINVRMPVRARLLARESKVEIVARIVRDDKERAGSTGNRTHSAIDLSCAGAGESVTCDAGREESIAYEGRGPGFMPCAAAADESDVGGVVEGVHDCFKGWEVSEAGVAADEPALGGGDERRRVTEEVAVGHGFEKIGKRTVGERGKALYARDCTLPPLRPRLFPYPSLYPSHSSHPWPDFYVPLGGTI